MPRVSRDEPEPDLGIFVLSGAAALIDEIVWSRQLVLVFGNTTQAVSAILTGFFGGMAIGSFVGGRIADRIRVPLRMYGLLELALVVVVLVTPVSFRLIGELYRGVYPDLEGSPAVLALRASGSGGPGAGTGDRDDGRDPADAHPAPGAHRRAELGVQPAVRREHDRGDRRHRAGRLRPDRAAGPVRGAGGGGRLLRGGRAWRPSG